ncbi:proteoglycan versican [Candidatus Magnetomorum sp. HK-1]|nr:proteoglycan versican [Candidatus Magnetomorum sp. HK-1]
MPKPKSVESYGFCIWHIGGYNKNFTEAANACRSQGGRLCTTAELSAAQANGAEWCSWGWVADRNKEHFAQSKANIAFPMQSIRQGCGNSLLPILTESVSKKFGANCCK